MRSSNLEIIRAEKMGFCFGVQDAVDLSELNSKKYKGKKIFMLGMLVHNEQVIKDLREQGIGIITEEEVLEDKVKLDENTVIIVRAHGTIKKIYEILERSKATIYDAACVFVKRIRELLEEKIKEKYKIIFIGDKNHPEVKGIISHGKDILVYSNLKELESAKLNINEKYYFIAQTTLNKDVYNDIKLYIEKKYLNSQIGNTICGATYVRQKAVEKLAKETDVVLIVGGKSSSNTRKLYEIAKNYNKNAYKIESYKELDLKWLKGYERIGITAGASTPEKSIIEIERIIKGEVL